MSGGQDPVRVWRTPDGLYLVQGAAKRMPIGMGVELPSGQVILASAKYYAITPLGAVVRTYQEPMTYSLDDTLGISDIHVVAGSRLLAYHWIDHAANAAVVREEVVLTDLAPCVPVELPFDPWQVIAAYERDNREPEPDIEGLPMEKKGLSTCAAPGCRGRDLILKLQAGAESWLRYCPEHARELLALPGGERDERLAADLARCRESWDWARTADSP